MRDPITVDFSLAEEFTQELASYEAVCWETVRLCVQRRLTGVSNFESVTVIATAVVASGGLLLRLRQYVGEYVGLETDRLTEDRAKKIMTIVEQTAVRRGLKVRPGVYSLPGADS